MTTNSKCWAVLECNINLVHTLVTRAKNSEVLVYYWHLHVIANF